MSATTSILDGVLIRQSFALAGFTLLFYDYFLTLSLEVAHIWNGPWTAVKVLFLLNRYGNLAGQTFIMLEETAHISHGSQQFCASFLLFTPFFAVFSGESIRFLIVMRACAVWGCKPRVAILFNTLYVLYGIAILATAAYMLTAAHPIHFQYLNEIGICFSPVGPYMWATWLASICLDTFVFTTVCYSIFQLSSGFRGIYQSRLTRLLARDAMLFYSVALFNSLFCIAFWTAYRMDPKNFIPTVVSFALLSATGQRVVLNLRRLRTQPNSTSDISREVNRQMAAIGEELPWSWSSSSLPSFTQSQSLSQPTYSRQPETLLSAASRHVEVELQDLGRGSESDVEATNG